MTDRGKEALEGLRAAARSMRGMSAGEVRQAMEHVARAGDDPVDDDVDAMIGAVLVIRERDEAWRSLEALGRHGDR